LNPECYTTDVAAFESALRCAKKAASHTVQRQHLEEAIELYRGELLPGYYEDWCLTQRGALREEYLQALHQLIRALEQNQELNEALSYALRAVSADTLREETHLDLMRLYLTLGQPATALRQYQE